LIFLAKLDRLNMIPAVLAGDVFVLECVVAEIASGNAGPLETARLSAFFEHVDIVDFQASTFPSTSLSRSDQSTLTWAIENHADWLVADERLLRRIAILEGLSVIGFPGILVEGARKQLLSPAEAKTAIDESISRHGCRISVALYQRLIAELGAM
jgi:predicted nucleic acid-binding protein